LYPGRLHWADAALQGVHVGVFAETARNRGHGCEALASSSRSCCCGHCIEYIFEVESTDAGTFRCIFRASSEGSSSSSAIRYNDRSSNIVAQSCTTIQGSSAEHCDVDTSEKFKFAQ
jgi:hypothetical protein